MKRRLPETSSEGRLAERLRMVEARLAQLERKPTVREVNSWSATAPAAPIGTVVIATDTNRLWVSVGSNWKYVSVA